MPGLNIEKCLPHPCHLCNGIVLLVFKGLSDCPVGDDWSARNKEPMPHQTKPDTSEM